MPSPAMLMAIAAVGGSLAVIGGLALAVARFMCDRLDRRFDEIKEQRREDREAMDRRFDELQQQRREDQAATDRRFDELQALIREALKSPC